MTSSINYTYAKSRSANDAPHPLISPPTEGRDGTRGDRCEVSEERACRPVGVRATRIADESLV